MLQVHHPSTASEMESVWKRNLSGSVQIRDGRQYVETMEGVIRSAVLLDAMMQFDES